MDNIESKKEATYSCNYEYKYPDGSTKSIRVREVTNGFIICIERYTPSSGTGDTYKDSKWDSSEYISKTNPLEKDKADAPSLAAILGMCD